MQSITIDTTGVITSLCKIAIKFNSDKCPYSENTLSGHIHPYTPIYDFLFSKLRERSINIAEIGIAKNDSINIWREYFSLANIYGFELNEEYLRNAIEQNLHNVFYEKMDVRYGSNIQETFKKINVKYDIIIDDSSHVFNDQIKIIEHSVDYLNENGILIIEDIFRELDEKYYNTKLEDISKYFSIAIFVNTDHENKFSGECNNDKILILIRNDLKKEEKNIKYF